MSPDFVWNAISGGAGALAVLSLWVLSLLRRVQLPWYFFEASERRNNALEEEAQTQNKTIILLTMQNGEFKAQIESLRNEIQYLRDEVRRARDGGH